jgi:NADH-quinone oxidoreductase subunit J
MNTIFYISAAVAVISTFMTITRANAVHALLYFIVSLLAVSMVFFVFGAPFVAALEVIIYAGAIMVLFVFVIMLLNLGGDAATKERQFLAPQAWIGPGILALVLLAELLYGLNFATGRLGGTAVVGPKQVGIALLGPYLIGVELASMLLLAGLVGAYHLGRHSASDRDKGDGQ